MRAFKISFVFILLITQLLAQVPQGISHQAVIRNASNELVSNSPIGVQIKIHQGHTEGVVVYSETHLPTSNSNGLISFVIGAGNIVSGTFSGIEWSNGPFFIRTEADPNGGNNFTITGVTELLSVPYAFVSQSSNALTLTGENGAKFKVSIDSDGNLIANQIPKQTCPGTPTVTDIDGNLYNTVLIGNQCWMKENLRTTKRRDGSFLSYPLQYVWYDNNFLFKESYGGLYRGPSQDFCPEGWRLPEKTDWEALLDFTGSFAQRKLSSTRTFPDEHPRWLNPNNNTDETGFSALPGGTTWYIFNINDLGDFEDLGFDGYWWAGYAPHGAFGDLVPWIFQIGVGGEGLYPRTINYDGYTSIRCIKE